MEGFQVLKEVATIVVFLHQQMMKGMELGPLVLLRD